MMMDAWNHKHYRINIYLLPFHRNYSTMHSLYHIIFQIIFNIICSLINSFFCTQHQFSLECFALSVRYLNIYKSNIFIFYNDWQWYRNDTFANTKSFCIVLQFFQTGHRLRKVYIIWLKNQLISAIHLSICEIMAYCNGSIIKQIK